MNFTLFDSAPARMKVVWATPDALGQRSATGNVTMHEAGGEHLLVVTPADGRRYVVPVGRLVHAREVEGE